MKFIRHVRPYVSWVRLTPSLSWIFILGCFAFNLEGKKSVCLLCYSWDVRLLLKTALYSVKVEGWKKKQSTFKTAALTVKLCSFHSVDTSMWIICYSLTAGLNRSSVTRLSHSDVNQLKNAKTCRDIAYYKTALRGFEGDFNLKTFFCTYTFFFFLPQVETAEIFLPSVVAQSIRCLWEHKGQVDKGKIVLTWWSCGRDL